MKVKITFFLACMLFVAKAQDIPNKVMELPQKYKIPFENVSLYANAQSIPGVIWQVYSDREHNPTYKDPGGNEKYKEVSFLQKFFIIAENREYVHIITESNIEQTGVLFEDFGWIKKENLLLWNHCVVTLEKSENKQIIIVNTPDHYRLTPLEEMAAHSVAPVLSAPIAGATKLTEVALYNSYFVYKQTPEAVLIGTDLRFTTNGENVKEIVLGWVSKSRLANWNYKVFLEPNVEKEAMKEIKGISKFLFHDKVSAGIYKRKKIVQAEYILWSNEGDSKRMPGNIYRFPVIEEKNGIYKVGCLGEVTFWKNEKGKVDQLKKEEASIVSPFTLEIVDFLWQLDSTQAKLKWAYENSYQMFEEAYTIRDVEATTHPLFLLATVKDGYELTELSEHINYLNTVIASSKKNRDKLVMGYCNILKNFKEADEEELKKMSMNEVNELMYGVSASYFPAKITLGDLLNETLVNKDVYDGFTSKLGVIQKEYSRMLNEDEYEFSFTSNNKKYYWINEELIP